LAPWEKIKGEIGKNYFSGTERLLDQGAGKAFLVGRPRIKETKVMDSKNPSTSRYRGLVGGFVDERAASSVVGGLGRPNSERARDELKRKVCTKIKTGENTTVLTVGKIL